MGPSFVVSYLEALAAKKNVTPPDSDEVVKNTAGIIHVTGSDTVGFRS